MKVLALATREDREEDGYEWFAVDPDKMYPETLEYVQTLLQVGTAVPMYLQQYVGGLRAADLDDVAWGDAFGLPDDLSPERRQQRAIVLEAARLVFTAMLREQVGSPIGVHITRDERWRL
jgi:hypothetical protein